MPELPEVAALAGFLAERATGLVVTRVDVLTVSVLKTYDPPVTALVGGTIGGVARRGKFLDLDVSGRHLVLHLARAGWLRWRDPLPAAPARPGRGPLALRVRLSGPGPAGPGPAASVGFELTEAGTQKRLAVYVVDDPSQVPGIARLGPDPLDPAFTVELLRALLAGDRGQLKGVLRDQSKLAGIGNAYSDEVLHAARLSPYRPAAKLAEAEVDTLYGAIRGVLTDALERAAGVAATDLKTEKKVGMRVHGRTGQPCPVCGDVVREVSFADSALNYCPTCQTGGRPLADRRLSRLLK